MSETLAYRIARAALALRWEDFSHAWRDRLRWCAIDYVGCAVAGARRPDWEPARLLAHSGTIEVPGCPGGYDPAGAALVLGTTGSLLQLQDVFAGGGNHPSSVIFPAAWAIWSGSGSPATRFLTALAAGYEVANRLAGASYPAQQLAGVTPTSSSGALGAAVAAGLLLDLDVDTLAKAIGTVPMLAPLTPFQALRDHGPVVPLHNGAAARAGVEAALLARKSWHAGPHSLEGSEMLPGWLALLRTDPAALRPEAWDGSTIDQVVWKLFPACFASHPSVEAALRLPAMAAGDIDWVELAVRKSATYLIDQGPEPGAGLYDEVMSARWAVARALTERDFGIATVAADAPAAALALADRIRIVHAPALDSAGPAEAAATIRLGAADGRVLELAHRRPRLVPKRGDQPVGSIHGVDIDALGGKFSALTGGDAGAAALRATFAQA